MAATALWQSVIRAATNCAGFGLGVSECRVIDGRKWEFDLAWPWAKVAFEREGGTWGRHNGGRSRHTSPKGFRDDCEKYNTATSRGWLVIRATVDQIESGAALDWLLAALALRAKTWAKT